MNSIAEDYYALRTEGIALLQKLSGQNWTDHNTHDPGITILEQLCYALTDLAYRIGHPIPDLLADPGEISFAPELYRVRGILTSGPVTLEDHRKILLDIDGVRNAWVEKTGLPEPLISATDNELRLVRIGEMDVTNRTVQGTPVKGMLKVKIEPGNSAVGPDSIQDLFENVMRKIMGSRNLGEDFIELEVLQPEYVRIDAELEVEEVIDPSKLLVDIYRILNRFISPDPVFYSLKEMLEKGYSVDQFMDGPPLKKGYLDPEEFKNFTKREFLRGSDLIRVLSEIPGVRYVRQLRIVLLKNKDKGEITQSDSWSVTLDPGRFPQLLIPDGSDPDLYIKLKRGEFTLNTPEFQSRWNLPVNEKQASILADQDLDIVPKPGRYRFPGIYQSIQNDFPLIYGIGEGGLTNDASPQLKARVKQLKAYLLFFDQILANAFAQLEGFRTFISYDNNKNLSVFSQLPEDVPDLDSLLIPPGREGLNKFYLSQNKLTDNTNENISLHRVVDHLLARMGEQISDYSLLGKAGEGQNQFLDLKKKLLERYVELSQARLAGINYTLQANGNTNRSSALQKRISLLLGISTDDQTDERFYLLEHQLLRPLKADFDQYNQKPIEKNNRNAVPRYYMHQPAGAGIFSLQVSYVFPWTGRFKNETFRSFAERLIRTETPAHIKTHVYWIDKAQFDLFEQTFQDWQDQVSNYGYPLSIYHSEIEENALLRLRLARNSVIDSLTASGKVFGYSYPVLDLPVEIKDGGRILEGERAEVKIKFSQKGVSYQLWNKEPGLSGSPVDGTGKEEPIILRTNVLRNDSRTSIEPVINFDILARKFTGMPETKLQQIVSVTIQLLQWDLKVDIVKGDKIMEGGEIDFNSEISVRIYKPQSGVIYTLYSLLLKDAYFDCPPVGENREYSVNKDIINNDKLYIVRQDLTAATPQGKPGFLDIKIPAGKITGDTILKVATSFGGANPLVEFLDARPGVFIRPDPGVSITMVKNDKARVQIASPEAGVLYTLFYKDKPLSSCAWLPQKGLVADEENASISNMRYELDFVLDAVNTELKTPLIFDLPEITEATTFQVKAQKLNTKLEVFLNKGLQAELNKADLGLKVEISKDGKIDFNSAFTLKILKPQKGITYTVYSALLEDEDLEYSFNNDSRVLNIDQSRFQRNDNLFIPAEELNASTNETGSEFLDIKVPAGKLAGDSIIKIGVSSGGKKPVTEFLDARVFVFTGPDPNVKISAIETEPRQILIDAPEAGVLYTLLMEGTPFSGSAWLPAKSLTVEGNDANKNMRLEVDFVPEATTEKPIRFVLPVITSKTIFSLKALKLNTKMEAPLNTTLEVLKTKINIKNNG